MQQLRKTCNPYMLASYEPGNLAYFVCILVLFSLITRYICFQVVVFVMWAFISFPLALLGTVVGRNWSGVPDNPCRVKTIPRPIPEKKWYLTPTVVALMGGLLPFGSIFIEMYFVFTSFWKYKVYKADPYKVA
jgi:hypothetical protein